MSSFVYLIILLVITATIAVPMNKVKETKKTVPFSKDENGLNDDLNTASSSYSHQYSNWGGNTPGGYGYSITGFGIIDDKINTNPAYKKFDGYDNSFKSNVHSGYNNLGYNDVGYSGNEGYGAYKGGNFQSGFGSKLGAVGGYNPSAFPGGYAASGYGTSGYGASGYGANGYGASGYGTSGYDASKYGTNGYGSNGYGGSGYSAGGLDASGYGPSRYGISGLSPGSYEYNGLIGNGGYGGYGGNGGLNSYSGYNNPLYKGSGHLGYGYYNKGGYGNIYGSGVTPSLVTGYRGYTRR